MAGRTFLVTGASSGIGAACARLLADRGHRVHAGVRRIEDGDALADHSPGIEPVLLDITDDDQLEAVRGRLEQVVGSEGLGGVVNNAGVARGGPVEHLPLSEWREQLEINVIAQVAVTRALIPLLRQAALGGRGGRIVFVGSISGRLSTPLMGPYGASKHAIEAVAESLRHELAPWGIRTAVIEPGVVRTAIWGKGRESVARLRDELPPEAFADYARFVESIEEAIEANERGGVAPEVVARAVHHALMGERPRARYLVGADARVAALVVRWLPDGLRDEVLGRIAGP